MKVQQNALTGSIVIVQLEFDMSSEYRPLMQHNQPVYDGRATIRFIALISNAISSQVF